MHKDLLDASDILYGHWEKTNQAQFSNVTKERVMNRNIDVILFQKKDLGKDLSRNPLHDKGGSKFVNLKEAEPGLRKA